MAYTNIDDPSAHFQAFIYTGNATNDRAITLDGNSNLQPDFYWYKARNSNYHYLTDSSRGNTKYIYSNDSLAEATNSGNTYVKSFDTNGVTLGAGDSGTNTNGVSFANWAWKANGGTTVSNTDGSITSTVQANTTAGFSIVLYTGTGSAATVGHGLGVVPSVMIIKNREYAASWVVYHKDIHADAEEYGLRLNNNTAKASNSGFWNNTAPTSSVFTIGGNAGVNNGDNTDTLVAYCFAEKQGYSKFGSYVGNSSTDGSFIYTGFKPAWIMLKPSSAADNWIIVDNKRDPSNAAEKRLFADTTGAEGTGYDVCDMLSNGFKMRGSSTSWNGSGRTYIYMAFAENPFVTSTGIPTTAR
ncbi:hypothetical protein OAV94_01060 [Candidatus Pelagibacter sp.]|nr:hypothetical protein [Candidatus Pelagibacter sp.]